MATMRMGDDNDALISAVDLTEKVFYCAKVNADGELDLAGSGDFVNGIIYEGAIAGDPSTVQRSGVAKVAAGAAITAGAKVQSNADGKAIEGSTNSFGVALTSVTAENQIVEVQIDRT